jgi:hypothetical protein
MLFSEGVSSMDRIGIAKADWRDPTVQQEDALLQEIG